MTNRVAQIRSGDGLSCWIGACGLAWRAHFNLLSSLCTTGRLVPLSAARAECERTAIAYQLNLRA